MATKPEFVVAKEKMLVTLVTVSVAISSPDSLRLTIVTSNVLGLKKKTKRKYGKEDISE